VPFFHDIRQQEPTAAEAKLRRWIYVPYDRLHDAVGPLAECEPNQVVLVFMESRAKGTRRPYHKKKLVLVLSAMRHFALEQAARGCRVVYGASPTSFADGLLQLQQRWAWKELITNRPAERELRVELRDAKTAGLRIRAVSDTAWLTTTEDFEAVFGKPQDMKHDPASAKRHYLMDTFYRAARRKTGLLMERGKSKSSTKPVGGKWSYDVENRRPYRGEVPVPARPAFPPDVITQEVIALINERHPQHFGSTDGFDLAVTRADAETSWSFALQHLLPHFGPWEDAMSMTDPDLFHSMTSPQLNLTLLRPRDLVDQVAEAFAQGNIPLASAEGFIRQVLGWREFMRHIHEATDGYRKIAPDTSTDALHPNSGIDQGAAPNFLNATRALPSVYWGKPSGMRCMDTVVAGVVANGWSHHITRLMVLSNLATLAGFSPRELTDWFWFAYVDAYDWVVETNVLGMSTFADGGLTATKPYVSGSAYIDRMSDFCAKCALDPKKSLGLGSCPFTAMYWTFLGRNEERLRGNIRLAMPLATLRKKPAEEREALRARAEEAVGQLQRGEIVS
jgi:deoxyribodipyrimidine photolyase-related protein